MTLLPESLRTPPPVLFGEVGYIGGMVALATLGLPEWPRIALALLPGALGFLLGLCVWPLVALWGVVKALPRFCDAVVALLGTPLFAPRVERLEPITDPEAIDEARAQVAELLKDFESR